MSDVDIPFSADGKEGQDLVGELTEHNVVILYITLSQVAQAQQRNANTPFSSRHHIALSGLMIS